MKHYLYKEDFNDFTIGEFPYDKGHSALGEYHHFPPSGYKGNWYDPISLHQWRSLDGSWLITSDGKKHYLEQNRGDNSSGHFSSVSAMLILKDLIYSSYTFFFKLRLFDLKNPCGMVYNYVSSKSYYSVSLETKGIIVYKRLQEEVSVIASFDYNFSDNITYEIMVQVNKDFKVYLDNELVIQVNMDIFTAKCGVIGKSPCQYCDILVYVNDKEYAQYLENKRQSEALLKEKKKNYPKLELIKKINLSNFGSGRQLRIARKENGEAFFILAQHQKRMIRDSYAHLSCLTAFDLQGNIMWQIGEPNNSLENALISCDLPFQVADINNDGKLEVIYAMNFEVLIVDALSGKLIKSMQTPLVKDDTKVPNYPFARLNVDAIRVADFKGLGYKGNFILKDRYSNVWAYDENMMLMWRYNHKNTGHFPFIYDFNQDGKDEMYVGYDYVNNDGTLNWSLPINSDHTDEILFISTHKNSPQRLYLASGNEGFNIVNMDGTIYKSIPVGHAQRISIADYDSLREGLEICVTSFWGADGILYLFDHDGNLLQTREMMSNGNLATPVAFDGKHILIMSNSSSILGGLLDYELQTVVDFPKDNHPTLCSEIYDLDNDGVDEILCWDTNEMWIYKAIDFESKEQYLKYDDNAFSNYRGEFLIKK